MRRLLSCLIPAAAALILASACETLPAKIDDSATVDQYLAQQRYRAACVGLDSQLEEIRTYTGQRLTQYMHVKDVRDCLCAGMYDTKRHKIDAAVGKGVEGSERDELAECLAPALDDTQLTDEARVEAVRVLGGIGAPASFERLGKLMKDDPDADVRALAAAALRPSRSSAPDLVATLQGDKEGKVRAAAAGALDGHKGDEVEAALNKALAEDTDGDVRAAALAVIAKGKRTSKIDDVLCAAMMDDESPAVRVAAVKAFHGTKKKKGIDCLAARLDKEEESGEVRQATMDALKASPSDDVKPILCKAVGPIIKRHVKDSLPTPTDGTDIMKAQNDRDWEASYDCVSKAIGAGGYSCAGRWYLANWYNNLGGNQQLPSCPGISNE